jgi:hypothetical protein
MSDSSSPLAGALLATNQTAKEAAANELFLSASQTMIFARRAATTSGLTWGYFGGRIVIDGTPTAISNGTVSLTASTTNYVEVNRSGVVSVATSRSADKAPLYKVITGTSSITSYEDERDATALARLFFARAAQAMGDANQTLTQTQALCDSIELTGTLTALRDVIVPTVRRQWTIFANVTGGFGVRVKTAAGSGITVADGKRAILECDGTNVVRVTPDT